MPSRLFQSMCAPFARTPAEYPRRSAESNVSLASSMPPEYFILVQSCSNAKARLSNSLACSLGLVVPLYKVEGHTGTACTKTRGLAKGVEGWEGRRTRVWHNSISCVITQRWTTLSAVLRVECVRNIIMPCGCVCTFCGVPGLFIVPAYQAGCCCQLQACISLCQRICRFVQFQAAESRV